MRLLPVAILYLLLTSFQAPKTDLRSKIEKIVAGKSAIVGVSIMGRDGNDTLTLNGDRHCPLQSVFKFHIALTVLAEVDKGKFTLNQEIEIQKKDLMPGFWSPLRDKNPNGGRFRISELIQYSVSKSDNAACDALLRLLGGPLVVEEYMKRNGIADISIKLSEEEQQKTRELMFQNWTTPKAATETLATFYANKNGLLSKTSYDFIWKTMRETETGQMRLIGQLPKGTTVAHKTGSSGTSKQGITEAVNDIGIVFLPNGNYFFISVFVTNSKEKEAATEKIIADIAKVAYGYFVGK